MTTSTSALNTLAISIATGKRHNNVMRDVLTLCKRNSDYTYTESTYVGKCNTTRPMLILEGELLTDLLTKYKTGGSAKSFETEYLDKLETIFSGFMFIKQMPILGGKYRLDAFCPVNGFIIEIDEQQHSYSKETDEARMAEVLPEVARMLKEATGGFEPIEDYIKNNWIKVIRIKEGELAQGIREILLACDDHSNTCFIVDEPSSHSIESFNTFKEMFNL